MSLPDGDVKRFLLQVNRFRPNLVEDLAAEATRRLSLPDYGLTDGQVVQLRRLMWDLLRSGSWSGITTTTAKPGRRKGTG